MTRSRPAAARAVRARRDHRGGPTSIVLGLAILVAATLACPPPAAARPPGPKVAVRVTGEDACESRVTELRNPTGKGVPVRSGPGREYPVVGRLTDAGGQAIYVCDSAKSDTWTGIVFTRGPATACNRPNKKAKPSQSPCARGWIRADNILKVVD